MSEFLSLPLKMEEEEYAEIDKRNANYTKR